MLTTTQCGWIARAGIWEILHQHTYTHPVFAAMRNMWNTDPEGNLTPVTDFVYWSGLTGVHAAAIEAALPTPALGDRQNFSPTLGRLLATAAKHSGEIVLFGYGVGPQRPDERITAEGFFLTKPPGGLTSRMSRAEIWQLVNATYGLDALTPPDEISYRQPLWSDVHGWWFWWD